MFIDTPSIGDILHDEFMEPLNISAYKLAAEIHVPILKMQDILHGRRKITTDISLRLARYFGVSDSFFLDMQNDVYIRTVKLKLGNDIAPIYNEGDKRCLNLKTFTEDQESDTTQKADKVNAGENS